jgi:hypothetical protein
LLREVLEHVEQSFQVLVLSFQKRRLGLCVVAFAVSGKTLMTLGSFAVTLMVDQIMMKGRWVTWVLRRIPWSCDFDMQRRPL